MAQKIISKIISAVTIVAILFALFAIFTTLTTEKGKAPSLLGYSIFRVVSGSMEPNIPVGSIIFIKNVDTNALAEGDVISFYSQDPVIKGEVNTHRIIGISDEDGTKRFITKGDANAIEDPYPVEEKDVIGKVTGQSAIFGSLMKIIGSKYGVPIFIILPLLLIFILNLKDVVVLFKKSTEEEIANLENTED